MGKYNQARGYAADGVKCREVRALSQALEQRCVQTGWNSVAAESGIRCGWPIAETGFGFFSASPHCKNQMLYFRRY